MAKVIILENQLSAHFISTIFHELRTPMAVAKEGISQVLEGIFGDVPKGQREVLSLSLDAMERLGRLMNDLLDISKIETGKIQLQKQTFDIADLVKNLCAQFLLKTQGRKLKLIYEVPQSPVEMIADYDRVTQIFTHLIENALKFTEEGTIKISIAEEGSGVICLVADSGTGIAGKDKERVFKKFEQLSHPQVAGEKGAGLGLAICKGLVELHGGEMSFSSQIGKGTTFRFQLPKRSAS